MNKSLLALALAIPTLLTASTWPLAAQLPAQKPSVYSVPLSNRVLEGEVAFAEGRVVKFGVLEGGLLSLESSEGQSLAISGEILDEERREIRVTVFEIQQFGPNLQGLKRLADFEVREGVADSASALKMPQVQISAIRKSTELTDANFQALRQKAMESLPGHTLGNPIFATCCVTCGTTRTCGCSVSDTCGSCCTDPCCGGSGTPQPQTRD